jgi:hypothetical protein
MEGIMSNNVGKEKQNMILEPLHVMIQLSLLASCPIGTKISVSNNTLHIQKPYFAQGIIRWWNEDSKDDLYYLYHAIRRFYIWYKSKDDTIYNYILSRALRGLERLVETYNNAKHTSITTTLALYKNILQLDSTELFKTSKEDVLNIDKVFQKITLLYDNKLLVVVYNILQKMETDSNTTNIENYDKSLTYFLMPTNIVIRNWIMKNLVV